MRRGAFIALALALAGIVTALTPGAGAARKATEVSICYGNKATDFLPLWIAAHHGFFNSNGIDAKLILATGGTGAEIMSSGACQIDMDGIVDLVAIANGAPYVAFGGDASRFEFVLVARTASNVNNVQDLKGKTVALSSPTAAVGIAGQTLLREFGVLKQAHIVYIPSISARLAALAAGSVDAMLASPPVSSITADGKAKVIYDMKKKFRFILVANWTTRSFAEQHPDVLRAFLRSWIQSVQWMKSPSHKVQVLQDIGDLTGFTDSGSANEAYDYAVPDFEDQPVITKLALQNSIDWVNSQTGKSLKPADVLFDGPLDRVLTYRLSSTLKTGKGSGSFSATLNRAGLLKWNLRYRGVGRATGAYVWTGEPGAHGAVGKLLCTKCGATGSTRVSPAVMKEIELGRGYVSVGTAKQPHGALSGKIAASPGS